VRFVHRNRSRGAPDMAFVDLHVKVDPAMSTSQAHAVASEVERRLVAELPGVSDALVHIEPAHDREENPWSRMASDLRQVADGMGLGLHDLHIHTDLAGGYTFELHLEIRDRMTLGEAHALADEYETRVRRRWPQAERVITHLEPIHQQVLLPQGTPDKDHKPKVLSILEKHLSSEQVLDVQLYRYSGHLSAAVKIALPAKTPLAEAHDISEGIEADLLARLPELERVTVHVEPQPESA
jgi:divalent metal cation (Fe/Co/Zn/Cd) transporter